MGSTKVQVPGPSAEERALAQQQSELLQLQRSIIEEQRQQQAVLLPFLAEQQGFDVEVDENGNIISISQRPDEMQEQRDRIEQMLLDRHEAALSGELPVDPALERSIETQERELRERLSRQFGPGFETSTPGIETLGEFFTSAEGLRHGARTGELTLAEQLVLSREQAQQIRQQNRIDNLMGAGPSMAMGHAGGFGATAQGFGQALLAHPDRHHRQLQTQASIANMQSRSSMMGGLGRGIGSLFGAVIPALSDEKVKENFVKISETGDGIPIYEFNFVGEKERHIGVIAQDVEKIRPDAVLEQDNIKFVDYARL